MAGTRESIDLEEKGLAAGGGLLPRARAVCVVRARHPCFVVPLSSQYGTCQTVKTGFWSSLSGKSPFKLFPFRSGTGGLSWVHITPASWYRGQQIRDTVRAPYNNTSGRDCVKSLRLRLHGTCPQSQGVCGRRDLQGYLAHKKPPPPLGPP